MRLKLKEAEQPISKLQYNIQNVVLPTFAAYGFNFDGVPTKLNAYVEVYKGVAPAYKTFISLRLSSASDEIDLWNEEGTEEFTADLFCTFYLGSKEISLGAISSRNPKSITEALNNALRDEQVIQDKEVEKARKASLIPPKTTDKERGGLYDMSPKTEEEWKEVAKKAKETFDKAKAEFEATGTKEQREQLLDAYANKQLIPVELKKIFNVFTNYHTFMSRIYPLDDEYAKAYDSAFSGYKAIEGIEELPDE